MYGANFAVIAKEVASENRSNANKISSKDATTFLPALLYSVNHKHNTPFSYLCYLFLPRNSKARPLSGPGAILENKDVEKNAINPSDSVHPTTATATDATTQPPGGGIVDHLAQDKSPLTPRKDALVKSPSKFVPSETPTTLACRTR